jgi:hypothetical protein
MKTKLIIIIGSVLGLVIIISCFVHFVSGVSATYPAIKKYEYSGSFKQLMSNIRNYTSIDSNLSVKITDKVGTKKNGYATYVSIDIKGNPSDIEYSIECEESNSGKLTKTTISLVEAYDKTHNTGGYNKEAKGIKPLVNNFDINFITPLGNTQNIKITPLE